MKKILKESNIINDESEQVQVIPVLEDKAKDESKSKFEEKTELQTESPFLTKELIDNWKLEFKKIYKTTINGQVFIWRRIRRKEYVGIISNSIDVPPEVSVYIRQDEIAKICILFPYNYEEIQEENGGLSTTISDEIIEKSGFNAYANSIEV